MAHPIPSSIVLRFSSPDRPGILAAVTTALADTGWDVRDASVYGDPDSATFFTRMEIAHAAAGLPDLSAIMDDAAATHRLEWSARDLRRPMRVLVAVSKFDHCLIDLLHKQAMKALPIEIVGVVSNHDAARGIVEWYKVPFHHLPMAEGKAAQEARFAAIMDESAAELVVLARYMQILSADMCARLSGRCINIHHSFLPSFKGAKPYHQAHARGIKLIGATAHYVTTDLDEGPIIEQDVRRVSHATTADEMVSIGREVEASVLSRAVRWHAEHRVLMNGARTVVLC
ncbi:formyltetrahydrofolate deformylase [Sphingobium sp.]|uniref:formyltetrahydrofolate deformylase n=1 Tax=Sphingobium sp. TaxID=1912891 RepID=UPI003B3A8CD2